MKNIDFTKMVGAGNDFVIIESAPKGSDVKKMAVNMCDRTNGIGADGLMLLGKSKKADFNMRIINADGSEAEMCGNGARCMAAYIVHNKKTKKKTFTIKTLAGIITAEAQGEIARVTLSNPKDYRANITFEVNGRKMTAAYIDTGVPHTVIFVHDLAKIDVATIGSYIRYHEVFKPRGTNVNFVERITDNLVECRTYERGVEDETKACGTGSVAAAIISYLQAHPDVQSKKSAAMKVKTKSKEILEVTFDKNGGELTNVRLKGSARLIAKGDYYV